MSDIFFAKSTVSAKHNYLDILEMDEKVVDFYEETGRKNFSFFGGENMIETYFRVERFNRVYIREDYDLLTYLGDLGGLLDIVLVLGMMLSCLFTSRMF